MTIWVSQKYANSVNAPEKEKSEQTSRKVMVKKSKSFAYKADNVVCTSLRQQLVECYALKCSDEK